MSNPDWGRLYEQGRCKAIGVAWTEEEAVARAVHGIPAEYVRRGILTLEVFEEEKKKDAKVEKETGEKPLDLLSKKELQAKAKSLGIEFTSAAPKDTLIKLIQQK